MFIYVNVSGGFGHDFSSETADHVANIEFVAKRLLAHGITSFLPTLISSSPQFYHSILPKLKSRRGGIHGSEVLGIFFANKLFTFAKISITEHVLCFF